MDNTNTKEVPEITNHNYCITDSKVFGTVKLCKCKPDSSVSSDSSDSSESNICLANFCISCGENLGEHNPRQYCYKIYCPYEN